MKKISFWAHSHKLYARVSIIFIYILLNILGLFVGDLLYSMQVIFTPAFWVLSMLITFAGIILYPSKKIKNKYVNFYRRQKTSDILLVTSTFLFIIYFGNSFNNKQATFISSAFGISINNHSSLSANEKLNKENPSLAKKDLKRSLRKTIKAIRKKYKESSKGQKTLYIIFAVLGAIILINFLSALSCSIFCSGSEALAYIVFFIGLGGIIFGLVTLIQRITRGKPKKKEKEPAEPSSFSLPHQ